MSLIEKYVEKVKEETKGYSEDEIVRYIYIDLGKRLSFNLDFFLGSSDEQKAIYAKRGRHMANESLESNIIICKDSSHIIEAILKHLGIEAVTTVDPDEYKMKCAHVFNIVRPKDGRPAYKVDLQQDLENIQAHMRTTEFGTSIIPENPDAISRDELERIDEKIGYISKEYYYADEYVDLLKLYSSYFKKFGERVKFVLSNIDIYHNKDIKYVERRKHHKSIMKKIFTKDEMTRIKSVYCYKTGINGREYIPCITVTIPKVGTDIYMFSNESNQYHKMDYEDLLNKINSGEIVMQSIPALQTYQKEKLKRMKDNLKIEER